MKEPDDIVVDMDVLQTSSSPNLLGPGPMMRRRKKRPTSGGVIHGTSTTGGNGGSGLNRNGIRVVDLSRGKVGYGFTISGQKPCLLRCIVDGSPASKADLRPGNCLVGVNGKDVSHLAHDEVVALIGKCTGLLRLHVADSYFSESSDEEALQINNARPKYHHHHGRMRGLNKQALSKLPSDSHIDEEQFDLKPCEKRLLPSSRSSSSKTASEQKFNLISAWHSSNSDPSFSSTCSSRRPPSGCPTTTQSLGDESPIPALPSRNRSSNKIVKPGVESVRVFLSQDNPENITPADAVYPSFPSSSSKSSSSNRSNNIAALDTCRFGGSRSVNSSSMKTVTSGSSSPGSLFNYTPTNNSDCLPSNTHSTTTTSTTLYQAVVGYIGSAELPAIEERKRLQALTTCIRRLRVERRMRSIVLLRIQRNGISLFGSNQNVQTGPPLTFYSSSIISFCGAYNEDRRFFGLVTCTNSSRIYSCHVFMVDSKLLSHFDHIKRARSFGIQCTPLPMPKYGQVLGLQECAEFPATADPILSSIVRLHGPVETTATTTTIRTTPLPRSPSEASTRLESTNSSNSDSGVGFRDDSDRNSAQIFNDINDSEIMFDNMENVHHHHHQQQQHHRFPAVMMPTVMGYSNHPHNQRSSVPSFSSNCPSNCVGCHDDDMIIRGSSGGGSRSASLPGEAVLRRPPSFNEDPLSLQEILNCDVSPHINRKLCTQKKGEDGHSNAQQNFVPSHIEVSVLVTPRTDDDNKKESCGSYNNNNDNNSSSLKQTDEEVVNSPNSKLSRNNTGTRSLDNLCSIDVFDKQPYAITTDSRGNIGSTPTLNQEPTNSGNEGAGLDFWEFKVPRCPPKPKRNMSRMESWAENIETLLADQCGREVFTEFLQHEFSAENILFYSACVKYKKVFPNLTECQRISLASTIFQRYVQNGASDPVNVDFQARSHVEKLLSQPTPDMFDLPLGQVYNLLKFDCYPRFIRSDMYRDYSTGAVALPQYEETSDSDQDSIKSHKLDSDGRRRSLLPWNIRNRSKNKNKYKSDSERLNSDISFIQRTAIPRNDESSSTDSRRQSYKLCRVTLPDNSTTVLTCKPGETLSVVVQRLLEKREFHYAAFEVVNVSTGKALDLSLDASEMTAKEIRVEPRSFIGIELPKGWKVGVRANPFRKVCEVLKPILTQHSLKLDSVVVYDIDTEAKIDVKLPMARFDGHNLLVKLKDPQLEEITNHIQGGFFDAGIDDDDIMPNKIGSSQTSSVFRGFLRRSSKHKRKGKANKQQTPELESRDELLGMHGELSSTPKDENFHPQQRLGGVNDGLESSPLSLASVELKLPESSRNRNPIYIGQNMKEDATIKDS